jgi:hypothetical protein
VASHAIEQIAIQNRCQAEAVDATRTTRRMECLLCL